MYQSCVRTIQHGCHDGHDHSDHEFGLHLLACFHASTRACKFEAATTTPTRGSAGRAQNTWLPAARAEQTHGARNGPRVRSARVPSEGGDVGGLEMTSHEAGFDIDLEKR